ncbi:hypothetical protein E2C01_084683 [Portunus trituberculatus]|uniref:Uncharacterized protein n=1 Tax=Portunus trituberculatus TaxID=210409 RepID=A0A5B7JBK2_PORTR|nr:hypothetical protein [Portunus trituberculatus]
MQSATRRQRRGHYKTPLLSKKNLCREITFSGDDVRPGCRMPPGNTGKVFREEVGDSPRACHLSPSRQQNWLERSRILPNNSADFVKDIRKRSVGINGRHLSFPRGSLCLFQNARARARQRRKASRHCERKLSVSLSPLQCMLRSIKERDA